ncbi:hypothetical protein LSTR_LSTR008392 [Laodelphax striatellus]|uniref:Abnormal spindle-like microcephaly-associated protein ASH domain-containing protein n=1 Tax=Laodelphax striatellus TaxID=195883 RepID=A0A482XTD5_LAOST|nr:hypothetical protein LSTR_LSTR008392 [Laodelphax striatellus]
MSCSDGQQLIRTVIELYTVHSASHYKNIQAKMINQKIEKKEKHINEAELEDINTHSENNEEENTGGMSDIKDSSLDETIKSAQQAYTLISKTTNKDDRLSIRNPNLLDLSNGAIEKHFGSFIYDEGIHDSDKTAPSGVLQSNPNSSDVTEVIPTSHESNAFQDEIHPIEIIYSIPIECLATVVRPIMEFSSQKEILPPTPCGSSSFASVYLRERPQDACVCGEKTKKREFTGNFYLTTDDDCINVQPISGEIHENMSQKIFIEYRPTLEKGAVMQKAYESQLEAEEKLIGSNKNVSGTSKRSSKRSSKKLKTEKKAKGTSTKGKKTPRKVVKIDESKYQQARESLLKSFEPIKKTVIISCKLEILIKNNHNENGRESYQNIVLEEIECHVVCTAVKPDFILKTAARKVDFGLVAGGMHKTMSVEVENISENPIYLRLSHLNPIGSFSHSLRTLPIQCKNYHKFKTGTKEIHKCSVLIDPEETHQIKITFASNDGDSQSFERLDIEGGKTKVVLFLQALPVAKGVLINPLVDFYRMECGFGGQKNVDVMVTSTSKALQQLSIKREYLKAIPLNVLPVFIETKAEKPKSSKRQEKSAESSKSKERPISKEKSEKQTPQNLNKEKLAESSKTKGRPTSKGKLGKQSPQNLNKEEKQFFDNYESNESYEFDDLFSFTFEEVEKIKSRKEKTESKEKEKKKQVESENNNLVPQTKSEIDLQPMGKCRLISMFSVKEADQLHNSVRKFQTPFPDLSDSLDTKMLDLSMQKEKLDSPDKLDSIAFYKSMVFVAKYKVILGLETTILDFYFVGKVIGK